MKKITVAIRGGRVFCLECRLELIESTLPPSTTWRRERRFYHKKGLISGPSDCPMRGIHVEVAFTDLYQLLDVEVLPE